MNKGHNKAGAWILKWLGGRLQGVLRTIKSHGFQAKLSGQNLISLGSVRMILSLRRLASELEEHERALQSLPAAIETRFLGVAQVLQEQVAQGDQLLAASKALNRLTGDMLPPGHPVADSFSMVSQALDAIEASWKKTGELQGILETYQIHLEKVRKTEDDWSRISAPLQIVQRLFRIESASLDSASFSFFQTLSERIAELHRDVAAAVHQQYESLQPTGQQLEALRLQLMEQAKKQAQALECRAGLRITLDALQEQVRHQSERQECLLRFSKTLSSHLEAVVVAIQYQDISRQKLEHIQAASAQIRQLCVSAGSIQIGRKRQPELASLAQACRIQTGQIQSVRNDLTQAQAAIQSGLRQILDDLAAVRGGAINCSQVRDIHGNMEALTTSLLEALENTERLLAHSMAGEQTASQAAQQFNQASSQVARSVRWLAEDIRLAALNAQIAVSRLQAVTGLEVLTQFTRQISEETYQFSEILGRHVGELSEGLQSLAEQCRRAHQQSLAESHRLVLQTKQYRQALLDYRDEVRNHLTNISNQMAGISNSAHSLLPGTELADIGSDHLQAWQDTFERVIAQCQARGLDPLAGASSASLEEFKQNYTMDSERAVHDSALLEQGLGVSQVPGTVEDPLSGMTPLQQPGLGSENASPLAHPLVPSTGRGVEDTQAGRGDGELFTAPASPEIVFERTDEPASLGTASGCATKEPTDLPSTEKSKKTDMAAPASSPASTSLGDNVELF